MTKTALITGASGLVGSTAARFFAGEGYRVVGIDNDMRSHFFGVDASTTWNRDLLLADLNSYIHQELDIRDKRAIDSLFAQYASDISVIIHAAAQPSHDWAAQDPEMDFSVNAVGTLVMLEATRKHCPEVPFIFTSTNKVYGDTPNFLPLVEKATRWELDKSHMYAEDGIDETMTIDQSTHSLFGVSKVAADLLVQEYGRYFGMNTGVFRGGCLTGPAHSGTRLHGFLSYLMRCAVTGDEYTVYGYKGKQVRDNIHSIDLLHAFSAFANNPRQGEVYNIGGGRFSNCSVLEAIHMSELITDRKMNVRFTDANRKGDHVWWISNTKKFEEHYPEWAMTRNVEQILEEIHRTLSERTL